MFQVTLGELTSHLQMCESIIFTVREGGKCSKFVGVLDERVPTSSWRGLCPPPVPLEPR